MPTKKQRRFTYVGGGSNKFWEVYEPFQSQGEWVVEVRFGKTGAWGQEHQNVFHYQSAAIKHYNKKIAEKLAKGYKEQGTVAVKKNVADYTPKWEQAVKPVYKPPVCQHNDLTRTGDKWKCKACGKQVEFDKPATDSLTIEVMETKVRRFFNLSARQAE